MEYIISRLFGLALTGFFLSLIRVTTGMSFEHAAIWYLLVWVSLYDGRLIKSFMEKRKP